MWCSLSLSSQSLRFFRCELLPCRKEPAMTGSPGSWPSRRGPPPCRGPDSTARAELPSFWNPKWMEIYTLSIPHTFESKGPCCSLSFPCKSVFRNFTCFYGDCFRSLFSDIDVTNCMSMIFMLWALASAEQIPEHLLREWFLDLLFSSAFVKKINVWVYTFKACTVAQNREDHNMRRHLWHRPPFPGKRIHTDIASARFAARVLFFDVLPIPNPLNPWWGPPVAVSNSQGSAHWALKDFFFHLHIHQGTLRVSESYLHSVLETCRLCDAAV